MQNLKRFRGARSAARMIVLLAASIAARAQMIYNVSVYNDASTDGATLYSVSTTVDNSTGCSAHGSYTTTATLTSPMGAQASNGTAGMVSYASMGINGVTGDYTATGTVQFYCGCFMHWVGGGGPSISITIAPATTYYTDGTPIGLGGCSYSTTACLMNSIPSCPNGFSVGTTGCKPYLRVDYIKAIFFGTITECFPVGQGQSWPGPGICN